MARLEAPDHVRHDVGDDRSDTTEALTAIRATVGAAHAGVYLGAGSVGPAWAGTEQAVLVLGPPRSGKTSSIVVPTVLGATGRGGVDVDQARRAAGHRAGARHGRTVPAVRPERHRRRARGVQRVRWSPVESCRTWDDALLVARSLVGAARPGAGARATVGRPEVRPLDRAGRSASRPVLCTPRHSTGPTSPRCCRGSTGATPRPRSGSSTATARPVPGTCWPGSPRPTPASRAASGRRPRASWPPTAARPRWPRTVAPDFDAGAFCDSSATLYICATGRHQAVAAPLVVGLLTDIRTAAYARSAPCGRGRHGPAAAPRRRCAGPGRSGQHRPHPRPPRHGQRGRWPGTSHPGVPPGPVPGPRPVGGGGGRLPVAVRHDRGAPGDRGRAHPRGALRPRR